MKEMRPPSSPILLAPDKPEHFRISCRIDMQ